MRECVLLLHGIGAYPFMVAPMAWHLRKAGYRVENLHYPAHRMHLGEAADWVAMTARKLSLQCDRLHLIGHSMGGVIARMAMDTEPPDNLKTVVQIGSPNLGSAIAANLSHMTFFNWWFGPALKELSPALMATHIWPETPTYALGCIAGQSKTAPMNIFGWLEHPNDGQVTVKSALPEHAADTLILPYSHTTLCLHKCTAKAATAFLRHETFMLG